jgi:AcrR family transcriptional regulator
MARSESRTKLLNLLSEVFRSRGYEGATLAQLARAAGLGKASLYHHFPGGKSEMASEVLKACASELDRRAYRKLRKQGTWNVRVAAFVNGFSKYVDDGARNCLMVSLTVSSGDATLSKAITRYTDAWLDELTDVFAESGLPRKRAARSAKELLGRLYGALALAQMLDKPKVYRQAIKRLSDQLQS